MIAPPTSQDVGRVVVSDMLVALPGSAATLNLYVDAAGAAIPRLRFAGHDGATVDCGAGPETECLLADVAVNSRTAIPIGVDEDALGADPRVVLFTDRERVSVGVVLTNDAETKDLADDVVGVYSGTAVVTGAGVGLAADALGAPSGRLEFPLTAEVFDDEGELLVAVHDPFHALSSAGRLVGELTVDVGAPENSDVSFPAQAAFAGALEPGTAYDVVAELLTRSAVVGDTGSAVTLQFEFRQRFLGLLTDGLAPQLDWGVTLVRTGESSGSVAPTVARPATVQNDPDATAHALTPWEVALASASTPMADRDQETLLTFAELGAGASTETMDLQACTYLDPVDWEPVVDAADGAYWGLASVDLDHIPVAEATTIGDLLDGRIEDIGLTTVLAGYPAEQEFFVNREDGYVDFSLSGGLQVPPALAATAVVCGGTATFDLVSSPRAGRCSDVPSTTASTATVDVPIAADACERIAARFGCEVTPIAPQVVPFATSFGYAADEAGCQLHRTEESTMEIDTVCRFSATPPPRCVDGLLCANGQITPSWTGSLFDSEVLVTSGDLGCADPAEDNALTGGLAIDVAAADSVVPISSILAECLADITAWRETVPPAALDPTPEALNDLFSSGACVDASRLQLAASLALEPTRAPTGEPVGTELPHEIARAQVGMRLLQRWLLLHAAAANEKANSGTFDLMFDGAAAGFDDLQVLDASLAGFDLLLHPRFAAALAYVEPAAMVAPDFREAVTGETGFPETEHLVGLPVAMYETLSAQLNLVAAHEERAALTADESAIDALRMTLPRAMVVEAFASDLAERAAEAGVPEWSTRFTEARREFVQALDRAQGAALTIQAGVNPLGIEDSDLPLYFLGDSTGPGGRFSAVSDYIIGGPSRSDAWAPFLVGRAADTLASAREAYLTQRDRAYRAQLSAVEYDLRIDELIADFDGQLLSFCGPTSGVSIQDESFRPSQCFVDDTATCQRDPAASYEGFTDRDWQRMLCPHGESIHQNGNAYGFQSESSRAFAELACESFSVETDACVGGEPCLQCSGPNGSGEILLTPQAFLFDVPSPRLSVNNGLTHVRAERLGAVDAACDRAFPGARRPRQVDSERHAARCYRGSIGESAIEIFTAARTIESASQAVANLTDAYAIAGESCNIMNLAGMELESANAAHAAQLGRLRETRRNLQAGAAAAGAVKDCAATASGAAPGPSAWAAGGSCVAGAAEAGLEIGALVVGEQIDNAITEHENAVAAIENQRDYDICMNDALMHLVGIKSAQLEAEQAAIDQLRAIAQFDEQLDAAAGTWSTGRSLLMTLQRRQVTPPRGGDWTDEDIATFTRQMRLARRATYLGVRAVEYEFQVSLDIRSAVLAAETPDDLEEVLETLWSESGTRSIGGARPTDLKIVLSLRDDILRLEGIEAGDSEGGRSLTPSQQLQLVLNDPANVVYDENGAPIGRRIPFTLQPLAALGLPSGAVSIFSTADCAERLWSVNASVLGVGGGSPFIGSASSFTRIDLEKSNVFHSQWCGGTRDTPFQVASVRPARNLFREPGVDSTVGDSTVTSDPTQTTSRARIQAHFNVDRAEFEADDFANGDTSELAARGLYGEYALFIPEALISPPSAENRESGLALERIDDILLRLDYVSVAD